MKSSGTIVSIVIKFFERLSVKAIGLVVSIVLARLIAPEQFGLIAIITVFVNLSMTFVQAGFSTSLVQCKNIDEEDYSTVFYISILIAFVFSTILIVCAPMIGSLYESEEIILPLRVFSLSLYFSAYNSVQTAKLQRELRFREGMICTLIATIISGVIGIGVAYYEPSLWALIIYYFSNIAVTSCIMAFFVKWRPKLVFSFKSAKKLFSYGWKILVSGLLCTLYGDIRSLVVGKRFSSSDLGYYDRGQQFPNIISNALETSIQSVMLPVLSRKQDNVTQVKKMTQKSISYGALVIIPAMIGLCSIATTLIPILLTEKWNDAIPYMQIISLGYLTLPITSSELIAIKAVGRSDIYMKLEFFRRSIMIVILMIATFIFKTVEAIAWSFVITSIIDVLIITLVISKLIGYSIKNVIEDVWKTLVSAIVMGLVIALPNRFLEPSILLLVLQCLGGMTLYMFFCFLLKTEPFFVAYDMLKSKLSKKL